MCVSPPSTSACLVCERFELWEKPERCQQIPGTRGSRKCGGEGTARVVLTGNPGLRLCLGDLI